MTLGLKFPVCLGQQLYQKCYSHLDQTIQTIFWKPPTHLKTIEFHFLLFPSPSTSKDNKVVVWAFIFWVCLPLMHPICIDPSESWVSPIQGTSLFHGKPRGLMTKGNSSEGHRQLKNHSLMTPNFSSTISWLFCTDLVNVMLKTGKKYVNSASVHSQHPQILSQFLALLFGEQFQAGTISMCTMVWPSAGTFLVLNSCSYTYQCCYATFFLLIPS